LREHRLEVAENGVAHGLLKARAGAGRRSSQLFEDSAENHKRDLPVMGRFGTRERASLAPKTGRNEVHEDLAESLLFLAGGC
jgi:hypothetical protein